MPFFVLSAAAMFALLWTSQARAQKVDVTVKVSPEMASAIVKGRYSEIGTTSRQKNLVFLNSAAGFSNLGNRHSKLSLTDAGGRAVAYKTTGEVEYSAEREFVSWSYETSMSPPADPRTSAHVSWITDKAGLLMLDDLLPQMPNAVASVIIEVPSGWKVVSTETSEGPNTFEVTNVEKAVFVIGAQLRERKAEVRDAVLNIVTTGHWLFDDADSARMAAEIYDEYIKTFGAGPAKKLQVTILPFPQKNIQKGTWEAETRGTTVTVISADMPFKTQAVQRLHEQLRHEIFHFWLPNGVNLTGNYDWFYEGFALYQSLKTGVALNQIRFEDFLDTLSRAHNIDSIQTTRFSLVEASQNRWKGAGTQVYARGMVTAFLCDLELLRSSNGKTSVADIFRKLHESHRPPALAADANTAVLKVFQDYPVLTGLVRSYVQGPQKFDWLTTLQQAGIENEPGNPRANLRVMEKPNGRQKALLDKLGYNNWRKLTRKP